MSNSEILSEHFILKGRLVGTDEGWADCICGWHYDGTVKGSIEEGERHLKENEAVSEMGGAKCNCDQGHHLPVWRCPVHGEVCVDVG